MSSTGAALARGQSKQNYQTPVDFMQAVHKRFGDISWDLAAETENTQCLNFFSEEENSFTKHWHSLPSGWLWLNPPFSNIEPWAKKCAEEMKLGARVLFLTPASIGSNWFTEHVAPNAYTLALNPRLSFDGKNPYPKDCQLSVFCGGLNGFNTWRWK